MSVLVRSFTPISIADLRRWRLGEISPKNPVIVSFDDGYRGTLTHAAPVLERFGIPAVVFVCTGSADKNQLLWPDEVFQRILHWPASRLPLPCGGEIRVPVEVKARRILAEGVTELCKRIPAEDCARYVSDLRIFELPKCNEDEIFSVLSWDEARELKRRGFDIGSHTVKHPVLTHVSPQRLAYELMNSKQHIESEISSPCVCFAYPNGDFSPEVVQAVKTAGYELGFTVKGTLNNASHDPLLLGRINIPGDLPRRQFEFRVTGLHDRLRMHLLNGSHDQPALTPDSPEHNN